MKIPAGVDNGERIRLTGEGEAGRNGGRRATCTSRSASASTPIFERDGGDLHCEVPISFTTAALGGAIEVPTLDGNAKIKVPDGTQSGHVFRLRGKGIKPVRGGPTGDLFCHVRRRDAGQADARAEGAAREFEDSLRTMPSGIIRASDSWLDGVKRFFDRLGE